MEIPQNLGDEHIQKKSSRILRTSYGIVQTFCTKLTAMPQNPWEVLWTSFGDLEISLGHSIKNHIENKRNPIEPLQKLHSTNRIPTRHPMEIVQRSCIIKQKSYILQAEIWKLSWNPNECLKGPKAIRCKSHSIDWQTQRNSPQILKYQFPQNLGDEHIQKKSSRILRTSYQKSHGKQKKSNRIPIET